MTGWQTLFYKEVLRFWKVSFQTVAAPVLTAVLYLLIFGHVLEDHVKVYDRISYTAFLVPGLVMMSVLQNSFANSSSSIIQSKIMGSLVFVLLTTHYLEEAEALCGRIAMLKAWQVVALNRTSELLKAASGSVLQFKTDAVLPAALASIARVTGRIVQLPAQDAAEIENHLATLRVAGVDVQDMEIRRPDLEDVFLQVMSGTSASNIPLSEVAL